MRRMLLVAALAATAFAAVPATAGQASTTPPDQLTGVGTLGQFGQPTAILGAVGNQRGSIGAFTVTYPDGTYVLGTSTCLKTLGNVAYLTGKIALSGGPRKAANDWLPGNYVIIGIEDNGNGTAQENPDRMNFTTGKTYDPGCGPDQGAQPAYAIVRGNFRVVDGTPDTSSSSNL